MSGWVYSRERLGVAALAALSLFACSSPQRQVPVGVSYNPPVAKTNPRVVEETPAYYVEKYNKSELIRVDDSHVKFPYAPVTLLIYREDADAYYIRTEKVTPEEMRSVAKERQSQAQGKARRDLAERELEAKSNPLIVTPEQFDTLVAPRSSKSLSFRPAGEGLPLKGQWRQNIAVADIDGDGNLDIVTSPSRLSGYPLFRIFLGNGSGNFREQKVTVVDKDDRPVKLSLTYGGVAVADFDGDHRPDIAVASHGQTIRVFLNRGDGKFQLEDEGLPKGLSSQAIAVLDVNGDGRLDLAVSQDMINNEVRKKLGKDLGQIHILLNNPSGGWKPSPDAIEGACFSFNIFPIDLLGNGQRDLLTGCRSFGGWGLTWKNDGKGKFSNELFEIIEQFAFHFAVAPGSFGTEHRTAFADLYGKAAGGLRAGGMNVYYKDPQGWHKVAVWRQKGFSGRLTSVAMGDLDGDGLDDLVFPDRTAGRVRIFFQTPAGRFEESPESGEPILNSAVADTRLADVDNDGRLDIVLAKTTFSELPKDQGGFEVLLNRRP